jgi:hypothetical protein
MQPLFLAKAQIVSPILFSPGKGVKPDSGRAIGKSLWLFGRTYAGYQQFL